MNRLVLAFVASEALLLALLAYLFIQNRSLRDELAARPAAPAAGTTEKAPEGDKPAAPARVAELEKQLEEKDRAALAAKEKHAKEVEALKKELAAAKAGGGAKPDEGITSLEEVLKKHAQALIYGADIPEDVVKALGLEPAQVVALKMAMDEELRRLDESMQRFYAANVPGATAESASKPAKELIMGMMGPIGTDMKELSKKPLSEQLKIHTTSSIEEMLGPDKFLSKLSAEVHGVRQQTYRDLERTLTPEQIAILRREYLREGLFAYDEQFKLEFGAAPKPK